MLGRSRLHEFYQRILREDMLTLFNHAAELKALECSIVLNGTAAMSDETKYRAACVLEILTGQRVAAKECDVMVEDPSYKTASQEQKREMERARGALIQQSMLGTKKKSNIARPNKIEMAEQIRKMGSGLKLHTHLHNVKMYYFLEKCREFYLPDILLASNTNTATGDNDNETSGEREHKWRPPTSGHSNNLEKRGLILHFEKAGGSKRDCYPERYPLRRIDNPKEVISCYVLKSTDLLKFPDIELHFEALGPVLGGTRAESNGQALQIILRPTLQTNSVLGKEALKGLPLVDNLKITNYLLSQFFNPYLNRPHIG